MKTASSKMTAAEITAVVHSTVIAGLALTIVAEVTLTPRAPTRPLRLQLLRPVFKRRRHLEVN